jgi:hypothetical protein
MEIAIGDDRPGTLAAHPRSDSVPSENIQAVIRGLARVLALAGLVVLALLVVRFVGSHDGVVLSHRSEDLIPILLALLVVALALAVVVFRPERGEQRGMTATSAAWSVSLLAALIAVWYLIDVNVDNIPEIGSPLYTQEDVDSFLAASLDPDRFGSRPPIVIPTGVLVQSIEFLNANNVEVAGYVWQRYSPAVPPDVARGFVLPEAVAEAYDAEEVYRFSEPDGSEVIGWYVSATLRQPFDYRFYPFDRQDIWIRLWHRDFEREVVLGPDFGAYTSLDPATLPGLEEQFVYGGWDPVFSGFSYALNHYNTTFGFGPSAAIDAMPELYFNVGLRRDFLGPLVDHIVLAAAVALLVFAVLTLTTTDEDRHKRTGGLSTAGVIGTCSGLLFAVLLEHNQIRSIIASQEVSYIEMLPLVLYAAILLAALNAVLVSSPLQLRLIRYRNNLLPDLLYWPAILSVLLVITIVTFY